MRPNSRTTSPACRCIGKVSPLTGELKLIPQVGGDQWSEIDAAVAEFSKEQHWPDDLDFTIRLILEELVLNAVSYGAEDHSTEVRLHLTSDDSEVRIVLSDNGKPFNPLVESPAPDLDASVEERKVGGLGVHFVQSISDSATYEWVEGHNQMTVVKLRG